MCEWTGEPLVKFLMIYYYMYMIIQNNVLYCVVVPHITDAIMDWVERVAKIPVDGDHQMPEVCIVEVSQMKIEPDKFGGALY